MCVLCLRYYYKKKNNEKNGNKILPLNVELDNTAAVPVIKKKTNIVETIHLTEAATVTDLADCG